MMSVATAPPRAVMAREFFPGPCRVVEIINGDMDDEDAVELDEELSI
jgi:hypothetical protein